MMGFPINVISINPHALSRAALSEWNNSIQSQDVAHNWEKIFFSAWSGYNFSFLLLLSSLPNPALLQIKPRASYVLGNSSVIELHVV